MAKDAFNGVDVTLFPGDVESEVEVHADFDESLGVSIISRPVLQRLKVGCEPCNDVEEEDASGTMYRPFGSIKLYWHKEGIAKQFPETFYVIESDTEIVKFGKTASSVCQEISGGAYPLGLRKQTAGTILIVPPDALLCLSAPPPWLILS